MKLVQSCGLAGEVEINAAGGGLEEANTPGKGKTEQPELFAKKAMKPKKKEFLQKRKQRKKAGAQSSGNLATASDDSGSDLEEAIMTDRNKPSFGEQAQQPLKVNEVWPEVICSIPSEFKPYAGRFQVGCQAV